MIEISDRNFWIAQVIGWGIFALVNFLIQAFMLGLLKQATINSLIIFIGGVLISTGYRYAIKKARLNLMKIGNTVIIIIVSSIVLTMAFLGVISIILYFFQEGELISFPEIISNSFVFGIIMLIWNTIYFMIHYLHNWKNAESEKWKLVAAVKDAQLGNLKAQINPHFMFNAINNIKALISEDAEKAKEMLLHFSDMFRYSLIHNDQSLVNLGDEILIVEKYLELLSIQFEEKLQFNILVEPSLNEVKIPPMMVQLLVENAIKHGISELSDGGSISVNGISSGNNVVVNVVNSGTLSASPSLQKKLGVGLNNIRERLQLIYGEKANLNLASDGNKVTASLTIPKSVTT